MLEKIYAIQAADDGTITITVTGHETVTARYVRETLTRETTIWQGDLTITIDIMGVIRDLDKAISAKSRKAIEMGGNVTAKATNVTSTIERTEGVK